MQRGEIQVRETYLGAKEDARRVIGLGPEFAPHPYTTDKVWVAYELISEEPQNCIGKRKGYSPDGFPVYHCSLTAFRVWATEAVNLEIFDVPLGTRS